MLLKLDFEDGGCVVLHIERGYYVRGEVWYKGCNYLSLGYIMKSKSVMSSTCLSKFKEAKLITTMMQELFSVFDIQPDTKTLKSLGYKECNHIDHLYK